MEKLGFKMKKPAHTDYCSHCRKVTPTISDDKYKLCKVCGKQEKKICMLQKPSKEIFEF